MTIPPHSSLCASAADVLRFWTDAGPARWFARDDAFDASFRAACGPLHDAARAGQLAAWSDSPDGTLALLLLLDQFPRNAFRGTARAFATDAHALATARAAIDRGFDMQVDVPLRPFFYMPFMHSEDAVDQARCVALCELLPEGANTLKFALLHQDIIQRFGRFPHRNAVLGREPTPQEQSFLDAGGFAG